MRTIAACLALTTGVAWAHPGHGAALAHLHAGEGWGLAALAVLAAVGAWLASRGDQG